MVEPLTISKQNTASDSQIETDEPQMLELVESL